MKTHRIVLAGMAVLLFAIAAQASPIFGTWKGEVNGRPITLSFTYVEHHVAGKLVDSGGQEHLLTVKLPGGGPPTKALFLMPSREAGVKLTGAKANDINFEFECPGGDEGTLRVKDGAQVLQTVKMTKSK